MSHHISDVIFWGGKPDRNYYVFVVLSILFGFIGVDHFYLRSYATGTQKFIMNLFTLGLWHWWDVSQIVSDGQKIRQEGLTGPFDWLRGIGRGVFTPLPAEGGTQEEYAAPKSYLLYTFLAVFFGWLGLDKFYMGTWGQGLLKLISCFNIFLILFGWLWVLWDAAHAFFMTDSILKDGISPPIPYSLLFTEAICADVFKVRKVEHTNNARPVTFIDWTQANMAHPHEIVANVINHAKNANTKIMEHATNAANIASAAANAAVVAAVNAANAPANVPAANVPAANGSHVEAPIAKPISATHQPVQTGGASHQHGPGPVIAGALSALVLAGGLKGFYDIISKQYG